ncbi:UDP-glucosyltransferase 2-like [Pectinophora gossypiella]|uniref:UDP-glucosyltransferase 2-like n=1 Tax=Pectinophora gossypiella TaxID=13191 RepID=UPI00214EEABA|nr:UDP-glucosyltransferase 2-like [Pectinophora gossypiella]
MKVSTFAFLLASIQSVCSFNILAIFPYHGKSHFLVYRVHLLELAKRGHKVTVISHFPEKNATNNYYDISLAGSMKVFADDVPMERSYWTLLDTVSYLMNSGNKNCEVMLENEQVRKLVNEKPKFDVVLLEQFNTDCALGIAYKLGAPVVATQSSVLMPWHYPRLGTPYNPSYVPFHFLEGGTKPSLFQRVERAVFNILFKAWYFYITQRNDQNALAKYYDDIPPLEDLARDIKFLLLYQNFVLTGSRLFPANVIEVGGYHVSKAEPLTRELKKFVDDAEHGVVYISFGSVVKSSTMPAEKREAVLEAMKEFPQRFIWKWEDDSLQVDNNKLFIDSWLPQVDILGHPKTKAFFTHAGMGGTTEGLHYGVPMIAMPIMGDQPSNAAAMAESGLGVELQYQDLTKETLVAALKKVLNPGFQERVKEISKAWHDRPTSALDTAVFWTEFAARHPTLNFRTAAADSPLYQYLCLDVISVFLVLVMCIFSPIILCCRNSKKVGTRQEKRSQQKKSKRQ